LHLDGIRLRLWTRIQVSRRVGGLLKLALWFIVVSSFSSGISCSLTPR
jgi:hypothetical protein